MDPNECWKQIIELCTANQPEYAIDLIKSLKKWLDNGGFEPKDFDRNLFESMCSWAGV